ncbi:hypothetical protein TNCV_1021411 [Trichonephila clavipes]|uniref:Uncharacterized protein n=1 Tax=Trichonephila clavipes TaxID=2585209 RepID=A0A8X6STZ0_TRICX|nr:hypothetical protein TNCV_1021411 [Trichonephila clavipes]
MPSPVQSNCDAHDTIENGQYGAVWSMGYTQQGTFENFRGQRELCGRLVERSRVICEDVRWNIDLMRVGHLAPPVAVEE